MKWLLRISALQIARLMPLNLSQNAVGLVVLAKYMPLIRKSEYFSRREDLWSSILEQGENPKILLLEFGVHRGYSIQEFAKYNSHPESIFVGFDSFEGLPRAWRNFVKVYRAKEFDVGGQIPENSDERVHFVKGWFTSTLPAFFETFDIQAFEHVFIHLDADIYSSTLYCLTEISRVRDQAHMIFDEFPGEEARALEDFLDVQGGRVQFKGYASATPAFPMQVAVEWRRTESEYSIL